MRSGRRTTAVAGATGLVVSMLVMSCSGAPAADNQADRTFLARMIPHHQRAIAVARIGEERGHDPRVRAFARRIVRQQTPELSALRSAADGNAVDASAGAAHALHRITDTQVAALRARDGASFDRDFVALNITSEQGAYAMARTELEDGAASAPRKLARAIANSPSQIRELQALLAALPR